MQQQTMQPGGRNESSGGPNPLARGLSVSVILPTFNRAQFIAASISSVLDQQSPPDELVVVDDGSTDGTREVVASFGDRVDYVHQDNQGKLVALEAGLDRVSGDLVWIMDDDDIVPDTALMALKQPFDADSRTTLSYGRMLKFSDDPSGPGVQEPVRYPTGDPRPFYIKLLEDCFITGHPCVLVRRDALEAMRPFDRSITASVDYYLHLGVARFGQAQFVDEVVLWQRQHGGARGPRFARYGEGERVQRWIEHDARLVEPLLREMSLAEFLGRRSERDCDLSVRERRLALVQKAVIAARKKLWPIALEALERAFALEPDRALNEQELSILHGCLGCRYGLSEVEEEPKIVDSLRRICIGRSDRDRILAAVSRPLLHQTKVALRTRDHALLTRTAKTWRRLMDLRASGVALGSSFARNLARLSSGTRLPRNC